MEYSASLDKFSKIATVAVFALIGGIAVFSFVLHPPTHGGVSAGTIIRLNLSFVFIVLMITMYYRPKGYALASASLVIHLAKGDTIFPLAEFVEARLLDAKTAGATVRTFGSGGFFGYFGKFYNFKLGSLTLYATQRSEERRVGK